MEEKPIGKTVYLPPKLWEIIENNGRLTRRKRSREIEFMLLKLLEIRQKNDDEAVNLAVLHNQHPSS